MFSVETMVLAAVGALAAQALIIAMWMPRFLIVSGLRIYSKDLALSSPMTVNQIADAIAELKSPHISHRVISSSQLAVRREPHYVSVTGVYGLITLSKGARFEALLGWPGVLFYVLILAVWSVQVDFSLVKSIVPALIVILIPIGEAARIAHAISRLETAASI